MCVCVCVCVCVTGGSSRFGRVRALTFVQIRWTQEGYSVFFVVFVPLLVFTCMYSVQNEMLILPCVETIGAPLSISGQCPLEAKNNVQKFGRCGDSNKMPLLRDS